MFPFPRALRSDDRGQALIEFLLVLPLILVLVAAVWEWGRLLEAQIVLSDAASAGAQYASSNTFDSNLVSDVQNDVMSGLQIDYGPRLTSQDPTGDVTVEAIQVNFFNDAGQQVSAAPGERVTVTVSIQVRVFVPFVPGLSDPYTMSASESTRLQ